MSSEQTGIWYEPNSKLIIDAHYTCPCGRLFEQVPMIRGCPSCRAGEPLHDHYRCAACKRMMTVTRGRN